MPKYAVIDCGTNTFHLLIARPLQESNFEEIYRERIFVKLAEDGIQTIGQKAYKKAVSTLQHYAQIIKKHNVSNIKISGTAALRTASNGPALVIEIESLTGLRVNVISGTAEAKLIHKGAAFAIGVQQERWMLMDIGGGSVEFIIADQKGIRWFESFPIGVAITYKHFHQSEPIGDLELEQLNVFLSGQLVKLYHALIKYPVNHLVGTAGTFDVIADSLGADSPTQHSKRIKLAGFDAFYERLRSATKAERLSMPDIPNNRADMIVVALVLLKHILELANIQHLTVSEFSMKEGMLLEMINDSI